MDQLWSPWRSRYIKTFGTDEEYQGCVFCDALASDNDDERYIVKRHRGCFSMLNLYPYNSGHLLIIPNMHVPCFNELDTESYREMTELMRDWKNVFSEVMHPQGFNIGSNIGRVGGAGIDQHVHLHIVPRWNGDANFMPVIGDIKVISESLEDTMLRLRRGFESLTKHFSSDT